MAKYQFGVKTFPHLRWPVAWYNPAVLLQSVKNISASQDELRNLDRRELFEGEFPVSEFLAPATGDFWWDFLSDTGDGGNATYTLARALQADHLRVEGESANDFIDFPQAGLLILGGDLAYPGASTEEYQYRFTELWEAARPQITSQPAPLLAIPQNHDWFDNLSSFNRHFISEHSNKCLISGPKSLQTRSYFAAKLPHGWWILGLDFALVGDIDRTQFETFSEIVSTQIPRGDNIILLYPEPYWTRTLGDDARAGYPRRYQRLEKIILAAGLRLRLHLAGDFHHYIRETAAADEHMSYDDMLITCGSGGAFLHPTHAQSVNRVKVMDTCPELDAMTPDLEQRLRVGSVDQPEQQHFKRRYQQNCAYPDAATSRGLAKYNLFALFTAAAGFEWSPRRLFSSANLQRLLQGNLMFPLLLGALYFLIVAGNGLAFTSLAPDWSSNPSVGLKCFLLLWNKAYVLSPIACLLMLFLFAICFFVASEDGPLKGGVLALVHWFVHCQAIAIIFYLYLPWAGQHFGWFVVALLATSLIVGGGIFGAYFALMAYFGLQTNNAFSPLACQKYKGFLRFKIDSQGNLHGYMLGTDEVPQRWVMTAADAKVRPLWSESPGQQPPAWKVRDSFVLRR